MSTWPTFPEWLLHSGLGGGLLLLLAWTVMKACRQPARRQRLGEAAVLAALLLCLLNLGPSWIPLPVLRHESRPLTVTVMPGAPSLLSPQLAEPAPSAEGLASQESVPNEDLLPPSIPGQDEPVRTESTAPGDLAPGDRPLTSDDWLRWFALIYAAASLFIFGRWVIGHVGLWRLLRTARPAPAEVQRLFETMARGTGCRPRLLVSSRLRTPLSCGLLRPRVVVPAPLCAPSATPALRCIFAHELAHLQRGDAWSCLLFGLSQAMYFCLPWFWWLRRQVRLCQEYIADAAAAEQADAPEEYAQFLVSLTRVPALPTGALGVFGTSSDLLRRVTMLLQCPMRVEKRCPHWWSITTVGALLVLALFLSGVRLQADGTSEPTEPAAVAVADPADEEKSDDQAKPTKNEKKEQLLRDLHKLLEDLHGTLDDGQLQELRDRLRKAHRDAAQADERHRIEVNPGQFQALQEHLQRLQPLELLHHEDTQRSLQALHGAMGQMSPFQQGRLGVQIQKPSPALADQLDLPKDQGLMIESVRPDSPAAKAGLKKHDILLEFNGKPVPGEPATFIHALQDFKPTAPVDAVVLRKGKKETIKGISLPEIKTKREFQFRVMPQQGAAPFVPGGPHLFLGETGKHGVITTIMRGKENFTTRHQEGSLIITVTGAVADGKSKVKQIEIQDGAKQEKYEGLDRVPEQYRDKVKNLIDMSEKNNLRIEGDTKAG